MTVIFTSSEDQYFSEFLETIGKFDTDIQRARKNVLFQEISDSIQNQIPGLNEAMAQDCAIKFMAFQLFEIDENGTLRTRTPEEQTSFYQDYLKVINRFVLHVARGARDARDSRDAISNHNQTHK